MRQRFADFCLLLDSTYEPSRIQNSLWIELHFKPLHQRKSAPHRTPDINGALYLGRGLSNNETPSTVLSEGSKLIHSFSDPLLRAMRGVPLMGKMVADNSRTRLGYDCSVQTQSRSQVLP